MSIILFIEKHSRQHCTLNYTVYVLVKGSYLQTIASEAAADTYFYALAPMAWMCEIKGEVDTL